MVIKKGRSRGILNLLLGYVILSVPALFVVFFFKHKSKKELEKLNENEFSQKH
ncbi:hypothetical protein GA0061094_2401 [[Bacillus] enclensis]|uniref:Uncharacterized protein n=1 Tax=[Bacillus] enclensis TaxID=1402860 RepID=A0A1C4BPR3_9BACI|nr:hypothetical protein GA0061094_2401 [[Bacillus] enclensis]